MCGGTLAPSIRFHPPLGGIHAPRSRTKIPAPRRQGQRRHPDPSLKLQLPPAWFANSYSSFTKFGIKLSERDDAGVGGAFDEVASLPHSCRSDAFLTCLFSCQFGLGRDLVLRRLIILLSCVLGARAAAAEPARLTGDTIKDTVTGSTVEIDTPLGTTVPIRFGGDGLMSGEAGDLASLLGSPTDRGRWWVSDDKLCAKWFRWFEAQPHCITIHLDGTRIFWKKDDGEAGTATLISFGNGGAAKAPRRRTWLRPPSSRARHRRSVAPDLLAVAPPQKFVTAGAAPVQPGHE